MNWVIFILIVSVSGIISLLIDPGLRRPRLNTSNKKQQALNYAKQNANSDINNFLILSCTDERFEEIEILANKLKLKKTENIIGPAIFFLERIVKIQSEGGEFFLKTSDGEYKKVNFTIEE